MYICLYLGETYKVWICVLTYISICRPGKLGLCLLTNTCMGIGVTLVSEWEVRQDGLTLDTLLQPLTIEDDFHMGWVLVMLLADTVFFLIIAW